MNATDQYRNELMVKIRDLVRDVPELIHTWRFGTTTVDCFTQYRMLAEVAHPLEKENDYIQDTFTQIDRISSGERPSNLWARGFFYNSAIMRLDALYERVFKSVLGIKERDNNIGAEKLFDRIKAEFDQTFGPAYKQTNWHTVRQQVNDLKHEPGGLIPGLRESPEVVANALRELIEFVSCENVRVELKRFYSGQGVLSSYSHFAE